MTDPFLCTDCQQLGYCRKYGQQPKAESYYKDYPEFDRGFYDQVNKKKPVANNETPPISLKLTTLEKIRALYREPQKEEMQTPIKTKRPGNKFLPASPSIPRLMAFPKPVLLTDPAPLSIPNTHLDEPQDELNTAVKR